MFTRAFWIATAERVIRGAAATFLGIVGAEQIDALHTDWEGIASATLGGAIVTLALCLVGSKAGDNPGPSFVNEQVVPVPPGK